MTRSHFFGAHQHLDLRPLGGPDLHVLEMGDQYSVIDRAGEERLWGLLDRRRDEKRGAPSREGSDAPRTPTSET